jgi:dGTPase
MKDKPFVNRIQEKELSARKKVWEEDYRGNYFRDTTAIIHSYPFRRLKHKTQVFFSPKNDHICTRIEHVMHVATISSTICRALGLNSDLAWAISLGHDLGHPPFGHAGEQILSRLHPSGSGFHHELYSLRIVDHLAGYGQGLNLTYAVRDGIAGHCGESFEQELSPDHQLKNLDALKKLDIKPATWEGCVVRFSDKIAYMGRDFEDAVQLKLIERGSMPEKTVKILGRRNSDIIDTLVNDLIKTSAGKNSLAFSDEIFDAVIELKDFNYKNIYKNPALESLHKYFERIILSLHDYLTEIFSAFSTDFALYKKENNPVALRFADYLEKMQVFYENTDGSYSNLVFDYIAGMTDDYAADCIREIMIPGSFDSRAGL